MADELKTLSEDCVGACPICCYQTMEEYNARLDGQLRNRALTQANIVCYMLVSAHIWFAYIGKTLPMPEYFYAVILVPYAGAAIKKVSDWIGPKSDAAK